MKKIEPTAEERETIREKIRESDYSTKDVAEHIGIKDVTLINKLSSTRASPFSGVQAQKIYAFLGEPEELNFLVDPDRTVEKSNTAPLNSAYMTMYSACTRVLGKIVDRLPLESKKEVVADLEGLITKYSND